MLRGVTESHQRLPLLCSPGGMGSLAWTGGAAPGSSAGRIGPRGHPPLDHHGNVAEKRSRDRRSKRGAVRSPRILSTHVISLAPHDPPIDPITTNTRKDDAWRARVFAFTATSCAFLDSSIDRRRDTAKPPSRHDFSFWHADRISGPAKRRRSRFRHNDEERGRHDEEVGTVHGGFGRFRVVRFDGHGGRPPDRPVP